MEQKIIELVNDAVRDAVAPLYEQMREIEQTYYPNEKGNEKDFKNQGKAPNLCGRCYMPQLHRKGHKSRINQNS